jgi:hypothetical protein
METRHQIKRTLSRPESVATIRELLAAQAFADRSALAAAVCARFGFHDAGGRPQRATCVKALRELAAAGHFALPAVVGRRAGPGAPRGLPGPVPAPEGVPEEVAAVLGLELVRVRTEAELHRWNELMGREHPQGAGPLVGRQLRYLIESQYGCLGGVGLAAAALQLADRDRWIGWDREQRRAQLDGIVALSRFLIRPMVHCHNLASKVLSRLLGRLGDDFETVYQERPWLVETFVDPQAHDGACFRAANWIRVGQTRGRGRQDRAQTAALPRKDIYVAPLEPDFRRRLGLPPAAGLGPLAVGEGLEREEWAALEFGGAPLGDARRSRRLVQVAALQAEQPGRAFSGLAAADGPMARAYYRLIDQPDESGPDMAQILAPHRQQTLRRMQAQTTVLCVQDSSILDFTGRDGCDGLGATGTNQTGAISRGLQLHSTFAVAPDGLPLGVVKAQCLAPPEAGAGAAGQRAPWLEHHRDLVGLRPQLPQTRLIHVGDREADFFELFDAQRQDPQVELLVRAQHDRNLDSPPGKLFAAIRQAPVQSHLQVHVPRQSARPKKSKQHARPARPGRTAELQVRYQAFTLPPTRGHEDKPPLALYLVHAREQQPPPGAAPLEWFLLTSCRIDQPAQAEQCLRWYCLRWRIEDWHRVLKSGCRLEELGHDRADRLRRAIAIRLVIAWRIMLMTLLGRDAPDLPATVLFSDIEVRTLSAYARKRGWDPPGNLREAVRLLAIIGGYLARKHDPPPGHQLLWQGYLQFYFMCLGFQLLDDPELAPSPDVGQGQG